MQSGNIGRRALLASAAASVLAAPAIAQDTRASTLRFIPQANLTFLDPIWTTAGVTGGHGFAVFDTLYGLDNALRPQPQMAEGHTVSDDGRIWTIRLRQGLQFHDGEPVRAIDCATSLARWSKRDSFGQAVAAFVDAWEAPDDRTIRIRLKRPMGPLLFAIAHTTVSTAFIMPERLARTDPATQVTEMVGSGPFRFLKDEYVSGSRMAYARFDKYLPRDELPEWTSGGKRAYFDRIEWHVIPDPETATAAMQAGEADIYEYILPDLAPTLARNPKLQVVKMNPYGLLTVARFNFLTPPFNNVKLRRAVLAAVDQNDYMRATVGDDPAAYRTCFSMYACDLPGVKQLAAPIMGGTKNLDASRKAIADAGYNGEKIVILNPTDYAFIHVAGQVTADLLTKLGMNVDLQEMDFGTLLQRRASRETVPNGGWSIFHTGANADGMGNPGTNFYLRGQGATGWPGWFSSPEIEQLTDAWMASTSEADAAQLLDRIQLLAIDQVPFLPLGQWYVRSALSRSLTGLVPATNTLFWNLKRV